MREVRPRTPRAARTLRANRTVQTRNAARPSRTVDMKFLRAFAIWQVAGRKHVVSFVLSSSMIPDSVGSKRDELLKRVVPIGLDVDGPRKRDLSSWNVRYDSRPVADGLQVWWSVELGRVLTQWEAFDLLLYYALSNPELKVPKEIRELQK